MILFFKNKIIKWSLNSSLFLNLLSWLLFYFRIPNRVEPIVLRYNIYTGINLIGAWQNIFLFSLAGLIIIILNFILAKKFFLSDKGLSLALSLTALISQIIILLYGVLIVVINS
jgi:hypothetical protein